MENKPIDLVIPELEESLFLSLKPHEQDRYLQLYREQVAAPFEEWRNPHRVKCAYGGRGAGAKSRSAGSLLIQFGETPGYFGKNVSVLCVRDVQKSIKESSWRLLKQEVERLKYPGWKITDDYIKNLKNGSYYVFAGLNDLSSAQLKSYESFDILFVEEGAPIGREAWLTIIATFRKKGSEIWCLFNRDKEHDPCYDLFCQNPAPGWSVIKCRPGRLDNPWWDLTTLPEEWARLKAEDPDEALHVYEGQPRNQSDKAMFSRTAISAMQDRDIDDHGAIQIGCDVARFGRDSTVAFKRKGMRVIARRECKGFDTVEVAGMIWNELAERDPSILIAIDAGYNPGVIDVLLGYGANVIGINFGGNANDEDKYANRVTEMYFELPTEELSIPAEYMSQNLFEDLTERLFSYDTRGRKKIESKDGDGKTNFKARHGGRSPDEGDALVLTFAQESIGGIF